MASTMKCLNGTQTAEVQVDARALAEAIKIPQAPALDVSDLVAAVRELKQVIAEKKIGGVVVEPTQVSVYPEINVPEIKAPELNVVLKRDEVLDMPLWAIILLSIMMGVLCLNAVLLWRVLF